jgi:hypothetical protein
MLEPAWRREPIPVAKNLDEDAVGRVGKDRVAEIDVPKWTDGRAKSRLREINVRDSSTLSNAC